MIIRPAGYSSDEGSEDGYESGYFDESATKEEPLNLSFQKAVLNGSLLDVQDMLTKIEDYENFTLFNGWKPLVFAAEVGNLEILEYILSYENDNNITEKLTTGYMSLIAACSASNNNDNNKNHLGCIEVLLNAGVDLNFKDLYGCNALMMACKSGSAEVVELLLSRGADVNDGDNEGWSALFYAVKRGDLIIIETLLKFNADINKIDKKNRLPYNIASEKGFSHIADLLQQTVISNSKNDLQPEDEPVLPVANKKPTIFDESYIHYYSEVPEMVSATAVDMKRYLDIFATNHINLRQLLLLKSEDEVRELGILFSSHRKTILERIRLFHLGSWSSKSLGLVEKTENENQPSHLMMVFTLVSTLHRQLYVLRSTIMYARDDILSMDSSEENTMIDYLKNIKTTLISVKRRLIKLNSYVNEINTQSRPFLFSREITD